MFRALHRACQMLQSHLAERSDAPFHEYYVREAERLLNRGVAHPTLGGQGDGKHLNQATFQEAGVSWFRILKGEGLRPHHVCVDYGCGSLRVGQHLIRHLEPGHYRGLDVTRTFIDLGVELMEPEVMAEKRPHLEVISPEALKAARAVEPDFVISLGVLQHVCPRELPDYLGNLLRITGPRTRTFVKARFSSRPKKISWATWVHDPDRIREIVRAGGGTVETFQSRTFHMDAMNGEVDSITLKITRPEPETAR
ncbi:MAG: class I SAM-dependent methyltransferase [Verrucomicrobiota bacterium]